MHPSAQNATAPRRLTLTIPSLTRGGAERAVATLANHWVDAGADVTLITLDTAKADSYPLDSRIRRVGLDVMRHSASPLQAIGNNLRRIRSLRRAIRQSRPDVVVSFLDQMNVLTLLATQGMRVPTVIAERTNPELHAVGRMWSALRRRLYPRCSALVVQTRRAAESMQRTARGRPICVVPNGVGVPRLRRSPEQPSQSRIVAMGRLSPEKGFNLLIRAFAHIAPKHPAWRLTIVGEGPQRAELESLIAELQISGRVDLPGRTSEPEQILSQCDLFVLSSRYEGFPNALLEAMACGLAVVSFDCPNGPDEIIRHGIDGLLVPTGNVTALAEALERLIHDESERRRLAAAATEVAQRFSLETFFAQWDELVLSNVTAGPPCT